MHVLLDFEFKKIVKLNGPISLYMILAAVSLVAGCGGSVTNSQTDALRKVYTETPDLVLELQNDSGLPETGISMFWIRSRAISKKEVCLELDIIPNTLLSQRQRISLSQSGRAFTKTQVREIFVRLDYEDPFSPDAESVTESTDFLVGTLVSFSATAYGMKHFFRGRSYEVEAVLAFSAAIGVAAGYTVRKSFSWVLEKVVFRPEVYPDRKMDPATEAQPIIGQGRVAPKTSYLFSEEEHQTITTESLERILKAMLDLDPMGEGYCRLSR